MAATHVRFLVTMDYLGDTLSYAGKGVNGRSQWSRNPFAAVTVTRAEADELIADNGDGVTALPYPAPEPKQAKAADVGHGGCPYCGQPCFADLFKGPVCYNRSCSSYGVWC